MKMRRSDRVQWLAFILLNGLLTTLLGGSIPPPDNSYEVPEQRLRIDATVNEIAKETWAESVESLLTNRNQYATAYGETAFGEFELEHVLGTRRAVKILNTLQGMPPDKRIQKCRELFDVATRTFEDAVFENCRLREEYGPDLDSHPRRNQTLHVICLALIATAETGRRDVLAEQFTKLDEMHQRIATRVEKVPGTKKFERGLMIQFTFPEQRFQLNVLRLAVLHDPKAGDRLNQIDAYCRSMKLTTNLIPVVAWDARTTWFETRVGSGADLSKGVTTYMFYDWGSQRTVEIYEEDPGRREIVQKVRALAL